MNEIETTPTTEPSITTTAAPAAAIDPSAALAAALTASNANQLSNLTPSQRDAVTKFAGSDPLKVADAIAMVRAAEGPRQTSGSLNMPLERMATISADDPLAIYKETYKTNPIAAARWANANSIFNK